MQFEADRRAFIITINSFGTELSMDDREKLYPNCGKLFPDGLTRLAKCEDYEQVKQVAGCYPVSSIPLLFYLRLDHVISAFLQEYSAIFTGAGTNPGEKTLEDKFFEKEVGLRKVISPTVSCDMIYSTYKMPSPTPPSEYCICATYRWRLMYSPSCSSFTLVSSTPM